MSILANLVPRHILIQSQVALLGLAHSSLPLAALRALGPAVHTATPHEMLDLVTRDIMLRSIETTALVWPPLVNLAPSKVGNPDLDRFTRALQLRVLLAASLHDVESLDRLSIAELIAAQLILNQEHMSGRYEGCNPGLVLSASVQAAVSRCNKYQEAIYGQALNSDNLRAVASH